MKTEQNNLATAGLEPKPAIQFYTLKLVEVKPEHDEVYTFRFQPEEPIAFRAGQWLHLGFPSGNRDKTFIRHMSVASSPREDLLDFTMDLASNTPYKTRMRELKIGDEIKAFKINGEFHRATEPGHEVVFLSGGIGITPVRALLRDIQLSGEQMNWSLCHVARDRFLYQDELSAFSNQQWRTNRAGLDGVWDELVNKPQGTRYFISGSDRFVRGMVERLLEAGKAVEDLITESFH